jgi:peptidoglycan/xylan/chitin deacetylase (PgdA/CDA1 family)
MTMLARGAGTWLSRGNRRGRLGILLYHRVLTTPDFLRPDDPTAAEFDMQMALVAAVFNVLPLGEAVERLTRDALPPRALCITFDDGYADNFTLALPVLRRYGLPATFFVAAGYLDGGRMWNDGVIESVRGARGAELDLRSAGLDAYPIANAAARHAAMRAIIGALKYLAPDEREARTREIAAITGVRLPDDLMMTRAQLVALHADGMEVGGHTVSHPILSKVDDGVARAEIADGRKMLSEIVRAPVQLFAYPNGRPGTDYDGRHARIVKELGFKAAVSTAGGSADRFADRHQLPRFSPWDRTPWRYVARAIDNYRRPAAALA